MGANSIVLTGIKHCGKTTLGSLVAEALAVPFFDTDALILEQTGFSARELYQQNGEKAFMAAETEAVRSVLHVAHAVIATGGGVCKNTQTIALLRERGKISHKIIYVNVPEKTAFERIFSQAKWDESTGSFLQLPAYIQSENPKTKDDVERIFHAFFAERSARYEQLADAVFVPQNVSAPENAALLAKLAEEFQIRN
ncbi:MAG: hypothetical protein Ta2A_06810 [Treponemataceae bacterium]|nr:MAG: hypothetical protein Ta2A_06810 [Treponemataceae bacterium]